MRGVQLFWVSPGDVSTNKKIQKQAKAENYKSVFVTVGVVVESKSLPRVSKGG